MKKVIVPTRLPKYISKEQMVRRAKSEMKSSLNSLRFWDFWKKGEKRKKQFSSSVEEISKRGAYDAANNGAYGNLPFFPRRSSMICNSCNSPSASTRSEPCPPWGQQLFYGMDVQPSFCLVFTDVVVRSNSLNSGSWHSFSFCFVESFVFHQL